MKIVKVICENGVSWTTNVSDKSTAESKDAYFIGQMFNTGSYPEEIMSKCVSAEYVYSVSKEYAEALEASRIAADKYREARRKYRNMLIDDDEFAIALEESKKAQDIFDIAHAKESEVSA